MSPIPFDSRVLTDHKGTVIGGVSSLMSAASMLRRGCRSDISIAASHPSEPEEAFLSLRRQRKRSNGQWKWWWWWWW